MADSRSVMFVSPIPMVVGLNPLPVSLIVSVSVCSSATAVTVTVVAGPPRSAALLQRFAAAVVERGFGRRRVAVERPQVQLHGDGRPRGERRQGLRQTSADQQRGVDPVGEPTNLGDGRIHQLGRLGQQRLDAVTFGVACQLDEHRQRDKVLLGAVMQIPFEAAPFFVGRGDQPGARCGELGGVFGELFLGRPQRRGVIPDDHHDVKDVERHRDHDERGLYPTSRLDYRVWQLGEAGERSHGQDAGRGDHGEHQAALQADVGLGEGDGHHRHQDHRRKQGRRDERDQRDADPRADADQRDRWLIPTSPGQS